ncbi:alpha-L-rhamnosidase-related protein [Catenibacillus scindens]|uniref:alpha-L-rhamnosidase-related protein n=1 Tax=Catenibacillus scindens TaxID=673271 RepID=UPI0038B91262
MRWGQKSNFLDFPTDCPQRDERMGWTCDAQVFLNTACFNMDSYAFYSKYLWDMAMTQKEVGCVTEIIPAFGENTPACSAWGDAATGWPWITMIRKKCFWAPQTLPIFLQLITITVR